MIDMCQKFHTNNVACLRVYYDQLCQMLRIGQAVLIKIHVFWQDQKGYYLQFFEIMSMYCGEAGMRAEWCREDCYDLSNLQDAGEQLSHTFSWWKVNLTRKYWSVNDMSECWQNVIKTFKQKRRWYGVQSAGGRFGVFFYIIVCNFTNVEWLKWAKNSKWCLSDSSTVLCLQFVLIYVSSN